MTIAEERDGSNTVLKRFLAEGVQLPTGTAPNTKLYYSKDHLGSIRSLTNENGTILGTLDYDAFGSVSRAPVPANDTSGAGPVLTSAVSRLTHSFAGTFDVNLPLSGAPGVEMRRGNGSYTLVLTFDRNVLSDTSTTLAAGVGTVGSTTFSGNTATISLSGVADRQTITVELDNVVGVVGVNAKVLVSMSICIGDVNQNGAVTVDDINAVKAHAGNAVTSSTFIYDLNHDGFIDSTDTAQDKAMHSQDASLFPDFAFTGHYYHARSGLYLALYRVYAPTIGRWLSRDPLTNAEIKEGPNVYSYVKNDPVTFWDPLGLRDYNCCETRRILAAAYADATAGPIQGLLDIAYNSTGPLDFKVRQPDDTFCVDGRKLSAPEFGNYIAGFEGAAYDGKYTPMAGGYVAAAGIVYHLGDALAWVIRMPKAEFDPLDFTGLPFIYSGYLAGNRFEPTKSAECCK